MSFELGRLEGSLAAAETYLNNGYSPEEIIGCWDDEKYLWKSLDVLYQDGAFGIEPDGSIKVSPDYELSEPQTAITLDEVSEKIEFGIPEENISEIVDHFRRHNEPIVELFSCGGSLEVVEEYEDGDKTITYNLGRVDGLGAFMTMEGDFLYPEVSEEIEEMIKPRIEIYLHKIKSRRLGKYL